MILFLEGVGFFIGVTTALTLIIRIRILSFGGLLITCWAMSNFRLAFLYCDCYVGFLYLFLTFFAVIFLCFIFSNCLLELWYQANYVRFLFLQYSSLSYLLHFNIFIESWLVISVFSLRLVSDRFASYTLRRMFSKVIPSSLISLLHTSSEA